MGLKTGLIGVWCEGADPATDQHTNGLTLTNNNTVAAVAGKVGTAGDFEAGAVASLSRADSALLSTGDIDFTIAAWVQLESLINLSTIAAKGNEEYWIRISNSRFRFYIATSAVFVQATALGIPVLATWYYLQMQHDATNNLLRIRVNDGAWEEAATGGTAPTDGTLDFSIGGISTGEAPALTWDGLINQFAFWKALKSDADLNAIYNSGNGRAFSAWDAAVGGNLSMADLRRQSAHYRH
jgi:hypothetical protein